MQRGIRDSRCLLQSTRKQIAQHHSAGACASAPSPSPPLNFMMACARRAGSRSSWLCASTNGGCAGATGGCSSSNCVPVMLTAAVAGLVGGRTAAVNCRGGRTVLPRRTPEGFSALSRPRRRLSTVTWGAALAEPQRGQRRGSMQRSAGRRRASKRASVRAVELCEQLLKPTKLGVGRQS